MNTTDKIFVAGHRGLVGSAIIKSLQAKGYSNIITRTHAELDLIDQEAVADFFAKEKPDCVVLAAAKVGGIIANNTYRGQFIYENLMIQNNVIHQSYVNGVKKLLFLGSTCIYPKEAPQPMVETALLTSPLEYTNEPYAIAKIAGIKMCESYNLQYGCNFISVMPTNLYGPNDNFDLEKSHVIPALVRKFHLGSCLEKGDWTAIKADLDYLPIEGISGNNSEEEILDILGKYGVTRSAEDATKVNVEVWGSGKPYREFLWSEDMADACVYALEQINFSDVAGDDKEVRNTHINIGTGIDLPIKELVSIVKDTTNFNGEIVWNTDKPDGTMRKLTDVSKIQTLGWKHQIDLPEGLKKLYEWYQSKKA